MSVVSADVLVIGGGPAGSTVAALLARRGVSVILVDRDEFPRDKLCGEFLSYDALPLLDLLGAGLNLDALGATRIRTCRVVTSHTILEFELPTPARGISRMRLDAMLLRCAGQQGATLLTGWTAEELTTELGRSVTRIRRGDETKTIESALVIGAWGRWGRIDRQLERSFVPDKRHRHFGFKRHYRKRGHQRAGTIDLYSFGHGYLGVSDIEEGLTNICGLVHASRLQRHRGGWAAFVETISREHPKIADLYESYEAAQPEFLSSEPVIFRSRSPFEGGVLFVGDAAGIIDPLTGNGMAMAAQSALLAASAAIRCLRGRDRELTAASYRAEHGAFFCNRLFWSRRVATLLSHPRLLDSSARTSVSPAIGRFLLEKTRASQRLLERKIRLWNESVEN